MTLINLYYNYDNSSSFFFFFHKEFPQDMSWILFLFYIPCVQHAGWHEWLPFHMCIVNSPWFFFFQKNISQTCDLKFWNNFFTLWLMACLFSWTNGEFFATWMNLRSSWRTYEVKATSYLFSSTLVSISSPCLYTVEALC